MSTNNEILHTIRAFIPHSEKLATSGQPSAAAFYAIRDAGFETVINLAHPSSSDFLPEEPILVPSLGMEYVGIPVVWQSPTLTDLQTFFTAMESRPEKRIFLHCIANMRVSAFLYLYRTIRLGIHEDEAKKDLHCIWEPDEWWHDFIEAAKAEKSLRA